MIACTLFLIPLLLLAVLAFRYFPNKWHWLGSLLALGMTLCFLWLVSRWDVLSMYYRMSLPLLLCAAAWSGFRRIRTPEKPLSMAAHVASHAINAILIVAMTGASWKAAQGYLQPPDSIELVSPLRDGNYVVLHGGASPLINGHYWAKSQRFAVDILGQDKLGRSARAFANRKNPDTYPIYSTPLYSPCNGEVMIAVDRFADQAPPQTDRENLAGNHVMIACKGIEVLLAHMKQGSVRVRPGDQVNTETVLGEVGNTGNSSEPHLHIHAETAAAPSQILDGEPVPFTIEGRFLVRGDRLL